MPRAFFHRFARFGISLCCAVANFLVTFLFSHLHRLHFVLSLNSSLPLSLSLSLKPLSLYAALMLPKKLLLLVAVAVPALAYEPVNCKRNDTQNLKKAKHITVAITDENNFCTMLTGYGVKDVASNEGCAEVYCQGELVADGHPMPEGYILSSHFEKTDTYVELVARAGRDLGVKVMGDNLGMPDMVAGAKLLEDAGAVVEDAIV